MKRNLLIVAALVVAGVVVYVAQDRLSTASASAADAPIFEVDPFWPKPLPDHMVLGSAVGVGVDSRDHVFIVHRGNLTERTEGGADADPPIGECCRAAPPVLEFDPEGNLVNSWGGPSDEYIWPGSNHGISVDPMDNIWIGGNGPNDTHILKFSRDGQFLASYGEPEAGPAPDSRSETRFNRVAKLAFDGENNEAYLADGYGGRRVSVIDMSTGEFKRYWGAYGNEPDDARTPPYDPDAPLIQQFRTPVHCADPSLDGHVYVCDRPNNRIQVFQRDGTFVDEVQLMPRTLGDGSTWDVAFSRDPEQKYLYVADGKNMKVHVLDRLSLEVLTTFGDGGRQPGLFFAVHSIATDSQGNIYTTETYEGKRVQKFTYMGVGPVTAMDQGAPWPNRN